MNNYIKEKQNNKKTILFILHIPPPVHGSSMVGQFLKESKTVNAKFNCQFINMGTSTSINEIGKRNIRKYIKILLSLYEEYKLIIKQKPQLCYIAITVKGMAFYKDSLFVLLAKIFNVKIVYHLHNKGANTASNFLLNKIIYRLVFKNTDTILLSEHLYSDIQQFVTKDKIHICPNGIPNTYLQKSNVIHPSKSVKILFLSNLIESKGVFILLEAMALLKRKAIPFECIFVGGEGDITKNQFLQKTTQLELQNHVKYLGKKYGKEKEDIFNNVDIFAFPTYYHNECFPLVLLEAMQHKLPIISTFEGGIRDIIENGETGFLIPQKNVEILADKLEYLIKNPELCVKMGEAGRKKYEKYFTLNIFENNMTKILHSII